MLATVFSENTEQWVSADVGIVDTTDDRAWPVWSAYWDKTTHLRQRFRYIILYFKPAQCGNSRQLLGSATTPDPNISPPWGFHLGHSTWLQLLKRKELANFIKAAPTIVRWTLCFATVIFSAHLTLAVDVCPSVRLSNAWIVTKRNNSQSICQSRTIQGFF